ncbi:hypothetical protein EXE43_03555 [Halorubrum sp. SS5]|nr:hypothetical protein EXE43_03555 [Halorubrum sp. SS5]
MVEETAENLEKELPVDASLYVDHVGDYQNLRSAFDQLVNLPEQHILDVVVKSGQEEQPYHQDRDQ